MLGMLKKVFDYLMRRMTTRVGALETEVGAGGRATRAGPKKSEKISPAQPGPKSRAEIWPR